MLGAVAAFKKLSLAQFANFVRTDKFAMPFEDWKELTDSAQKRILAEHNEQRKAAHNLAKAQAAALKKAAKQSRGRKASSAKRDDGAEDAYTRQGRMSQRDWRQMFPA